jgi:hypothetical protein
MMKGVRANQTEYRRGPKKYTISRLVGEVSFCGAKKLGKERSRNSDALTGEAAAFSVLPSRVKVVTIKTTSPVGPSPELGGEDLHTSGILQRQCG